MKAGHTSQKVSTPHVYTTVQRMTLHLRSLNLDSRPGYGSSGKIHAYFATATLNELENRAGSRANLPYELVVSTDEALQHAYLFETTSEGILTRDTVPGSCVLYVRDTLKNIIVWTRSDPNDTEEAIVMDAPPPNRRRESWRG